MRRALSIILILSLGAFFQAGCGGVGVRITPASTWEQQAYPSSSWPDPWEEPSLDLTPFIIGTAVVVASVVTFAYLKARRDKIRYVLTPEGEQIRILIHAEAPEDAVFLGDIHAGPHSQLDYVKNDLRNKTAILGGDLVVVDDIQQDIYDGQTRGYRGIGRAYRVRDRRRLSAASYLPMFLTFLYPAGIS